MGVVFDELSALYSTLRGEPPVAIARTARAIRRLRRLAESMAPRQDVGGPDELLAPAVGNMFLKLPTDHRRPALSTQRGASHYLKLDETLTVALKALSRQAGATLFMTLLAAFQVLLHHLTGQDDIAVGSPMAGRNRAELEKLIGFFVNMLVLRADLAGDPDFREVVRRVREVALGAYAHQICRSKSWWRNCSRHAT